MEWTEKQILETLRTIEASDYDEVKLETGDFKLHVRKSGAPAPASSALSSEPPQASPPAPAAPTQPAAVESASPPAASAPETPLPAGLIAIKAPMMGTFYRAPAPHAPPFVEVGASVKPDDTVCLIEVMKLFNTIKAGTGGKVVKVLAQNAATVRRNEVLVWIDPAG